MSQNNRPPARKRKRRPQQPDNDNDNEGGPLNVEFCDAPSMSTEEFASLEGIASLETVENPLGLESYISTQQHDLTTLENFVEFDTALNLNKTSEIAPDNLSSSTASTSRFLTARCDIPAAPPDQHFEEVSSETPSVEHEVSFQSSVTTIQKNNQIDSTALHHPEEEFLVVPMSDCVLTGHTDHANHILESFPPLIVATEDDVSLTDCIPEPPWMCSDSEEEAPDETPTVDFQILLADENPVFEETVEDESPAHHHDQPLFPGSAITIKESFISILSLVQSEHMSGKGLVYAIGVVALTRIYVLCAQMIPEPFNILYPFLWFPNLNSKVHTSVLCGTADAPATAMFLNLKHPSGFYSCPVCECVGLNSDATGKVTVFPYHENCPLRTMEKYENQVKFAVDNKVIINTDSQNRPECCGVKGPTLLSYMVPEMFSSSAVDTMHCVYLGVMRQLLHLFCDRDHRDEPYSIYSKIKILNSKLKSIRVPHFVERIPQLIDKLVYWKASELRTFLFYLCLCVLNGVLDAKYFDHLMLFVQGVALLNSSSVSDFDLVRARLLLDKFVKDFQSLFGLRNMSHNVHKCLHLPLVVENLAPLHLVNCFKYEDMNGRIARLAHGSRHAGLQIYSNLSMVTQLPLLIHSMKSGPAKEYCVKLSNKWMRLKLSEKISNSVYSVGCHSPIMDNTSYVKEDLAKNGFLLESNDVTVTLFHRLLKNKLLYVSSSYKRGQRISSFVQYHKHSVVKYGNLDVFVKVTSFENECVTVNHIMKCKPSGEDNDVIDISEIETIMYLIHINEESYIAKPLNDFEME
ncbi:hypothetical protein FOCC_FOCC001602 [Frankliniella occidentalis]|nr:hypothetical protein FOCC_FOCC001602 [Frankliniella occidentalis]